MPVIVCVCVPLCVTRDVCVGVPVYVNVGVYICASWWVCGAVGVRVMNVGIWGCWCTCPECGYVGLLGYVS